MSEWIRGRDIQTEYSIGKTKAYDLLREFQKQTDPKNIIRDSRILLIKKAEFKDWWRRRGDEKKNKVGLHPGA